MSNALSGLPLLCKGCGERIVVPSPRESLPEPAPEPNHPTRTTGDDHEQPDLLLAPTVEDSQVNLFLTPEARKKLFLPIEGSGAEMQAPPAPEAEPMPALPAAAKPTQLRESTLIDAAAFVIALCLGAFLGELATGKSTLRVFGDTPASPTFPPTDLLLWVGAVAGCGLLYGWLVMRGWSLGPRLRRR